MAKLNMVKYIEKLGRSLPELVSNQELVDTGLFCSNVHLCLLRKKGEGPPYIRIGGRIKYHREDVIEWLKNRCWK